jgi:hypothetical protein
VRNKVINLSDFLVTRNEVPNTALQDIISEAEADEHAALAVVVIGEDTYDIVLEESAKTLDNVRLLGGIRALISQINIRLMDSELRDTVNDDGSKHRVV